jgi:hypothetical protein
MAAPESISSQDHADDFVDQLMDEFFSSGPDNGDQDEDSGDADSPPNFWQGPINTGPVSFDKPIDDPVTSGSDAVEGPSGTVDNGNGPGPSQ